MLTRTKRIITILFILFTAVLAFGVYTAAEMENDDWLEAHEPWEDVQFLTGVDNYAYTTFYDPATQKQEWEETAAALAAAAAEADNEYEEFSGAGMGFITSEEREDDDVLRVYLPVAGARLSLHHIRGIQIGDVTYHSGDRLTGITSGETVTVAFLGSYGEVVAERSVRFYEASGTASLYIQLKDGNIREIAADKSQRGKINYQTVNADGTVDAGGTGEIHGRGNNNKSFEKKSYSINLDDAASLLGMETASKWALRATPDDYTMLMDKLVLDTAKAVDIPYSVDSEHVNVYIDGEYEGVYLLTQRIKVGDGAVDMSDGYLMEFETGGRYEEADQGFVTTHRNIVVHSPSNLDEEELGALGSYVQEAEDAIYSGGGINPTTGKTWFEYLDAASWIKQYWIQEFFINYDADYTSTYMTKDKNDPLLYAGPSWDFDKTFWHTYYNEDYQSNMLTLRGRKKESWMQQLEATPDFMAAATEYYLTSFSSVVQQVEAQIPAIVDRIGPSLLMMYDRYQYDGKGQEYVDGIADMFEGWYQPRLAFYEDYLTDPSSYVILYYDLPTDVKHYAVFAVKKGEPVSFEEPVGGCSLWSYDGGKIFQNGDTFEHDTIFYPLEDGEESEYEGSAE